MSRNSIFGRPDNQTSATTTLVGVNVAIFVLNYLSRGTLTDRYAMQPLAIGNDGEVWRLLTAAFLHAGVIHLAFNMIALWSIGQPLERLLGRNRFLILYFLAALGGSVASYTYSSVMTQSVGASGAIFGLLAAFIFVGRRAGFDVSNALMLLVINVAIGFQSGIDWRAHFGGAIVGAAAAVTMVGTRRSPRRDNNQVTLGVAMIVIGIAVAYFIRTKAIMNGTAL